MKRCYNCGQIRPLLKSELCEECNMELEDTLTAAELDARQEYFYSGAGIE